MERSQININDFAAKYAECGNAYEAALFAGAGKLTAAFEGIRLLSSKAVRNKVAAAKNRNAECPALQGLRRIAFGRNNDAVRLAFSENITNEDIDNADLFGVAEIKCGKGGIVEMKFFDRLKALDLLSVCEREQNSSLDAQSLINAIYGRDGSGSDSV